MTFFALLTKELRSRMRRERTIWLMVIYVLLLGTAGLLVVNSNTTSNGSPGTIGIILYYLLSLLQLFLIVFITPAFTATAVNGEKERQTYDLLLCSQLSGFTLITGKLIAGLMSSLLLIASSIPLFSLLLFFGGVAPTQLLLVLLIYIVTTLQVGCFSLFCSALVRRPAISTAIAYVANLLWLTLPLIVLYSWQLLTHQFPGSQQMAFIFVWSPVTAILSLDASTGNALNLVFGSTAIASWIAYTLISLVATGLSFLMSVGLARANRPGWSRRRKKLQQAVPA